MTDYPPLVDHRRVGDLLGQARERKGWTRSDLAKRTGQSVATIAAIEAGQRETTYQERQRLARALQLSREERLPFLRGDVLSAEELDALILEAIEVLRCTREGVTYIGIQRYIAAARTARLAARDQVAA